MPKIPFEMHETVRAGLEGMIAPNVRRTAHTALAAWYRARAITTAEIFFISSARGGPTKRTGRPRGLPSRRTLGGARRLCDGTQARVGRRARKHVGWPESGSGPIPLLESTREIGGLPPVNELLRVLRAQPQRFVADYHWGLAIVEAILDFEPERLHDLIVFALEAANDGMQREVHAELVADCRTPQERRDRIAHYSVVRRSVTGDEKTAAALSAGRAAAGDNAACVSVSRRRSRRSRRAATALARSCAADRQPGRHGRVSSRDACRRDGGDADRQVRHCWPFSRLGLGAA